MSASLIDRGSRETHHAYYKYLLDRVTPVSVGDLGALSVRARR